MSISTNTCQFLHVIYYYFFFISLDNGEARCTRWKDVSTGDLKIFFSLLALMGIVRKPRIEDYWASGERMLDTPYFRKYMSRNQFQLIWSNLHLADNVNTPPDNSPNYDPLYKVRPFVTMCENNFLKSYSPGRDLALDEGGCPWKGRVFFKVYNPRKPNKFSMKFYQIAESQTGYVLGFEVYTGKKGESDLRDVGGILRQDLNLTTKLVMRMLKKANILDKGHCIYMDNYYNSIELFEELFSKDTYACGTVRSNRKGLPKALSVTNEKPPKKIKLKKGDSVFRRSDTTLALKWHDKRAVYMISTFHDATEKDYKVNYKKEIIVKPVVVIDYTKNMLGVDLFDQMEAYYCFTRKTNKWWRKMFIHMFNMVLTNAYILYKVFHKQKGTDKDKIYTHSQFVCEIVKQLVAEGLQTCTQIPRHVPAPDTDERLKGRHFPSMIDQMSARSKRKSPSRVCYVCSKVAVETNDKEQRHWSCFWCPKCRVVLCVGKRKCFEAYHTQAEFTQENVDRIRNRVTADGDRLDTEEMRIQEFLDNYEQ